MAYERVGKVGVVIIVGNPLDWTLDICYSGNRCCCFILMVALDPYGNWGRIVTYLCQPLWAWMANGFHELGAHPSLFGLAVAALMLVLFSGLAWWKGRIWCNTVCPVGTLLGCVSRHSLIRPAIDTERCIACKKCERDCKSSCIDIDHQHIDYSRCVACFDCVKECPVEALTLKAAWKSSKKSTPADTPDLGRRALLGTLAVTLPLQALAQKTDGRIATGSVRGELRRETPVVPAGAKSLDHLTRRCNACGLCISKCPAKILRPSTHLATLFKPQMDFSRGWCPPECTLCSEVCPTDAIAPLTPEEKSAIHIGHAVWDEKGCLSYAQGISCGDCARHCPAGAIRMVKIEKSDWAGTGAPDESLRIPVVDPSRCIGCGACENACPAEPLPAIHVEGYDRHAVTEPNLRLLRQKK